VAVVLGLLMVGETLLLIGFTWSRLDLGADDAALFTFSFLALLYFAVSSIVSARERRWFWSSRPSGTLVAALVLVAAAGTGLASAGLPGLAPLPWWQALVVFGYAMTACRGVNDAAKVAMIKRVAPAAWAR
jgi:H+-transporting ATPase